MPANDYCTHDLLNKSHAEQGHSDESTGGCHRINGRPFILTPRTPPVHHWLAVLAGEASARGVTELEWLLDL